MDAFTNPPAASALPLRFPSQSARSESGVNPLGKTRLACNRCHAQKLKCLRKAGQSSSCERCIRLKTPCRFSPRMGRTSLRRPEHVAAHNTLEAPFSVPAYTSIPMSIQYSDTDIAGVSDVGWLPPPNETTTIDAGSVTQTNPCYSIPDYFDTPGMCWGRFFGMDSNLNPLPAFEGPVTLDPTHGNVAGTNTFDSPAMVEPCLRMDDADTMSHSDFTPSSMVQRIAGLEVALHECSLKLPFPINAGNNSARIGTRKSKLFALDELFRLTTDFLDIITCLPPGRDQLDLTSSPTTQMATDTESTLPLDTNSHGLSNTVHLANTEEVIAPFPPFDEATMFMIISCHCRLTEIYVSLFKMMHACIEHSLAPRRDKDWAIILPQLRVGSISSPPVQVDISTPVSSATSSMYMLMITMLSSQLWEQLAHRMRAGDGVSVGMRSRSVLTEDMWSKVTDKNDGILQTIDNTRQLLQLHHVVVA